MKSWCWPLTSGEFKYICPRARMFHALVTLRNLLLATSSIAVEVFHRTWPIRQHRKEVAQAVHVVCALICFTKKKRKKENECVWEDGLHWKHATSCWYCGSARTHAHKYILYICVWIRTETTSYCQAPVNFIFKTDRWQHITRVLLTVAALSN